jgi:hypothetical protein
MGYFGWLLSCCVSDDRRALSGDLASAAFVFASGVITSALTLYLAGLLHVL